MKYALIGQINLAIENDHDLEFNKIKDKLALLDLWGNIVVIKQTENIITGLTIKRISLEIRFNVEEELNKTITWFKTNYPNKFKLKKHICDHDLPIEDRKGCVEEDVN